MKYPGSFTFIVYLSLRKHYYFCYEKLNDYLGWYVAMPECVPSKPKILLLILCMLAIFSTSLISVDLDVSILRSFFQIKALLFNMMHIPLFMILTVLWLQITQVYGLKRWQNILSAVLVTSFVGILYELTQMTIPGRNPSLHDIFFNTLGSMLGIILYCTLEHASPSTLKRLVCQ